MKNPQIISVFALSICSHLHAAIGWVEGDIDQATVDSLYNGTNQSANPFAFNGGVATSSVLLSAATGSASGGNSTGPMTLISHQSGDNFTGTFTSSFFDASSGVTTPLDLVWAANNTTFFRNGQLIPQLGADLSMDVGDKIIVDVALSHLWLGPQDSSDRDLSTVIQNISLSVPGGSSQSVIGFNQSVSGNNIDLTEEDGNGNLIIALQQLSSFTLSGLAPDSTNSFSADGGQGIYFREFKNDADVTNAQVSGYSFELEARSAASLQAGDEFFLTLDGNLRPDAIVVPEPSGTLFLFGALLPLIARRRR